MKPAPAAAAEKSRRAVTLVHPHDHGQGKEHTLFLTYSGGPVVGKLPETCPKLSSLLLVLFILLFVHHG